MKNRTEREKELLRQQVEALAEHTENDDICVQTRTESRNKILTEVMCKAYGTLNTYSIFPAIRICLAVVSANLVINLVIKIKKLFRGEI